MKIHFFTAPLCLQTILIFPTFDPFIQLVPALDAALGIDIFHMFLDGMVADHKPHGNGLIGHPWYISSATRCSVGVSGSRFRVNSTCLRPPLLLMVIQ